MLLLAGIIEALSSIRWWFGENEFVLDPAVATPSVPTELPFLWLGLRSLRINRFLSMAVAPPIASTNIKIQNNRRGRKIFGVFCPRLQAFIFEPMPCLSEQLRAISVMIS
mmetsp:Transcript_117477/g.183552  ORF Transcript_117477/g.183552 Transcript_117477/m.183552 type:complete len:110 (-) Transcript_117477:132-461(-)